MSFFAAMAVAIAVGGWIGADNGKADAAAAAAIPELGPNQRDPGAGEYPAGGTFAPLVKKTAPAVVSIQSTRTEKMPEIPEGFGFPFFFGPQRPDQPQERRSRGVGSGVIISSDGYILTNHHVIEGADEITVVLNDDRELEAEVVGSDDKTDVALVKVEAQGLPTLPLGNSDAVEVGDIVLALGNPFGVGQTVTMGIVGATSRQFGIIGPGGYEDFIQTDAAINRGNSGGALINTRGELIGINTAILSPSGGNSGVGFAVPVNLAHHVMKQLAEGGRVVRGYMGVGIQDLNDDLAKQFNAPDSKGALVGSVEPGSPADKAGFERGDVIRKIEGDDVENARGLRLRVANSAPGTTLNIGVLRDGQPRQLSITLGELPGDAGSAETGGKPSSGGALSGVSVDELTPRVARQLGAEPTIQGVVVTGVRPGTPAEKAGLRSGDIIQEVARKPVISVEEFREAVATAGDGSLLLLVHRGGGSLFLVVER